MITKFYDLPLFTSDWCLIFFMNMGDLLFEQKFWLKVNFMVLYDIPKLNVKNQWFLEFCRTSFLKTRLLCSQMWSKQHLRTVLKIFKFFNQINTSWFNKSHENDEMLVKSLIFWLYFDHFWWKTQYWTFDFGML